MCNFQIQTRRQHYTPPRLLIAEVKLTSTKNVASEAVKGNREWEEILKRLTPPLFRQNQPLFVSRMVTIWSQNSLTVAISVTSTGS